VPVLLAVGLVAGCGEKGPRPVPVSGRVTLDGRPLVGAMLNFWSTEHPRGAKTVADGRYEMINGVYPGTYKVTMHYSFPPRVDGKIIEPGGVVSADAKAAVPTNIPIIPPCYTDYRKTKLEITVEAPGTDSANFDLHSVKNHN